MMHPVEAGTLGRAFRGTTDAAYREAMLRHANAEREKRQRKEDLADEAEEAMNFAMAMVSVAETDAFRLDLDRYDAATVAALQTNEQELLLARERIDRLLAKAHVLPDGRRVFKTEDGQRVFDEHGTELEAETIRPDEIDDRRPRWETFKGAVDRYEALDHQRRELLDYQSALDDARERLDNGELTRKEFDALRDDLKTAMPDAVRAQIPELAQERQATNEASADAAETLDLTDDLLPPAFATRLPEPGLSG